MQRPRDDGLGVAGAAYYLARSVGEPAALPLRHRRFGERATLCARPGLV